MLQRTQTVKQMVMDNKGFTLVEMAIVLIIIGIIIGAVVKGKDLVRSAEQKKIFSQYVKEWQVAYMNYYDRTGWILGDDATDANTTRDGHAGAATVATEANLEAQLAAVGLTPPVAGATGNTTERTYTDSDGIQRTLVLRVDYRAALGNYIRIAGIPNDLGLALDRIVDSTADGNDGDVIYTADYTADPIVAAVWPSATTAPVANSAMLLRLQF